MNKKLILGGIALVLVIVGLFGLSIYQKIFGKAITKNGIVFIKSTYQLADVQAVLNDFTTTPENFIYVAEKKKFTKPKAGRYHLKKGMSMNDVVNLFRSGRQTAVKVSFNNQDTLEKLAGRIAQQIDADSISLLQTFTDETFLTKNNFNKTSVLGMFVPNSYEVYWNTSAEKFRNKMLREYKRFWNEKRMKQAKEQNLTPQEVVTLASIVQKETAQKSERPIVAGLYLNRLRKGIPLQADPTVIYCVKQQKGQDFVVKRVLNKDLIIDSPYNTYKYAGLPPTLIAMPDISAIDAVLAPKKHDYIYMCASVEKIGYHDFAKTLAQHERNAAKYRRWISKQGINR